MSWQACTGFALMILAALGYWVYILWDNDWRGRLITLAITVPVTVGMLLVATSLVWKYQ